MTSNPVKINREMVESLYAKTLAGSLQWELNEARQPTVTIGNYKILLTNSFGGGSSKENLYILSAFDEDIDNFDDELLDDGFDEPKGFETYFELMKELRLKAFRKAVGADKAVSEIMNVLRR